MKSISPLKVNSESRFESHHFTVRRETALAGYFERRNTYFPIQFRQFRHVEKVLPYQSSGRLLAVFSVYDPQRQRNSGTAQCDL